MFQKVLSAYQPLIRHTATKWLASFQGLPVDFCDIKQEIEIAIYMKYGYYDRRIGSWATFIGILSLNKLTDLLEFTKRRSPKAEFELDRLHKKSASIGAPTLEYVIERFDPSKYSLYGVEREPNKTPLDIMLYNEFYRTLYTDIGKITYSPRGTRRKKNKTFAQQLFLELTSPSEELFEIIRERMDDIDDRHIYKKRRFTVTERDLAEHFGVTVAAIRRCFLLLRKTVRRTLVINNYKFTP